MMNSFSFPNRCPHCGDDIRVTLEHRRPSAMMDSFFLKQAPNWEDDVRVRLGASVFQKPPTDNAERFLSMLRFDSGEK